MNGWELAWSFVQGKIYPFSYRTDSGESAAFSLHARNHDQCCDPVQRGFRIPSHLRRSFAGTSHAHVKFLLGFCLNVSAPGSALEYDSGYDTLKIGLRLGSIAVAVYGLYAFIKNQFLSYLFLTSSFVFFDFERPLPLFFTEYIAIMGLFVFLAHCGAKAMQTISKKRKG